jgi:acetyl/propionyl-CoA carboxylase alpha subunit
MARLRRALDETVVGGVQTDLSFLHWLLVEPGFVAGNYDTGLIEERWGKGPDLSAEERSLAAQAALQARALFGNGLRPPARAATLQPRDSAWAAQARREAVGRRRSR